MSSKLIGVMIVLQGLILLGQFTGAGPIRSALAEDRFLPDPASRQLQMIDELKSLNGKMDKLLDSLESGKVQVKVVPSDEKN